MPIVKLVQVLKLSIYVLVEPVSAVSSTVIGPRFVILLLSRHSCDISEQIENSQSRRRDSASPVGLICC